MRSELTAERPPKWMRDAIPGRDVRMNRCRQLSTVRERAVFQHGTSEEAEPYLDLIDPRCVQRRMHEVEAATVPRSEGRPPWPVMDVEVVPNDVHAPGRIQQGEFLHEAHEPLRRAPPNSTHHRPGADVEGGEQRARAVTDVLVFATVDAISLVALPLIHLR